jgi:plastocyanin
VITGSALVRRRSAWIAAGAAVGLVALLAVIVLPSRGEEGRPEGALDVSMIEMAFVPEEMHASPGQEIYAHNDGVLRHSMLVVGLGKGVELGRGETRTFTLPDDITGTYEVICDLPGHREAGMVGSLTISDAEVTSRTTDG